MQKFFSVLAVAIVATTMPALAGHDDRQGSKSDRPAHAQRVYSAPRPERAYSAPRPERAYSAPRPERAYSAPRPERAYIAPRSERTYIAPRPEVRAYHAPRPERVNSLTQPEPFYRAPRPQQAYRDARPVRDYRTAIEAPHRSFERFHTVSHIAYPNRMAHAAPIRRAAVPERFARTVPFVRMASPFRERQVIVRHEAILRRDRFARRAVIGRAAPFEEVIPARTFERRDRDAFAQTVYVNRADNDGAIYQRWVRQARDYDRWTRYRYPRTIVYNNYYYNYENAGRRSHRDDDDDDGYSQPWNGYYDNAVYNNGYYNNAGYYNPPYYDNGYYGNNGYYNNGYYGNTGYYDPNGYYGNGGYYDPNAYNGGTYPYGYDPTGYGGVLGNLGTIVTLAQLAGVNLGDLGQLATLGGNYPGLGYPASGFGAPAYSGAYGSPYSPQQLSGLVVSNSGSQLIVMTPNFTPVVVDDAPAYQFGYVPGGIATGRMINAVGYYNGSTFVATAIQ